MVRLHTWTNATHFLNLSNYEGGKDGFIPEAGETAASLFTANANTAASSSPPRYLVVVIDKSRQRCDDPFKKSGREVNTLYNEKSRNKGTFCKSE